MRKAFERKTGGPPVPQHHVGVEIVLPPVVGPSIGPLLVIGGTIGIHLVGSLESTTSNFQPQLHHESIKSRSQPLPINYSPGRPTQTLNLTPTSTSVVVLTLIHSELDSILDTSFAYQLNYLHCGVLVHQTGVRCPAHSTVSPACDGIG